ncbi:MAG: anhydro-N-acetylmuramic acid kinase [SAR324 cluster bacterium]|nr:anhydro-N-acetylmuramic acid kinase [SAR324 cluster bacterium]
MPTRIARLAALCDKPERLMLGRMSGTSLDGLDLALCRVIGHGKATRAELLHAVTDPYGAEDRARLRALTFGETVSLRGLTIAHAWLAEGHARSVLAALESWGVAPDQVDCLASHGQTLYHAPESWQEPGGSGAAQSATLQIGDGDRLAVGTGILTVSDFRQKELAGGGQGAPLAPYAEALLFGGAASPRILLNLGGIANFNWLPAAQDNHVPVCGDTGPGNTLLDLAVRRCFPEREEGYDRDGGLAGAGQVNQPLLARLKDHPYFKLPCPKSTGQETFGETYLEQALATLPDGGRGIAPEHLLATLTRLSAETVAETLRREISDLRGVEIYTSGGGARNGTLMRWLAEALPELQWRESASLGLPPDFKEAMLFAVLANETLCGEGFPARGDGRPIGFGKISFPD